LADAAAVALAGIGSRVGIGNQAAGEPHYFNVAAGLRIEPAEPKLSQIELVD
jgi:hypothetical protein